MLYIKLNEDMSLTVTANEPIYRGDNLSRKAAFLIPATVGEVDMLTSAVFLTYIRADGTPDIEILERGEEAYNEDYYRYTFPITSRLSAFAGEVVLWLEIYSGEQTPPVIAKSGECVLRVRQSRCTGELISNGKMTALYQMYAKLTEQGAQIEDINEELSGKADGLIYDAENETLQLSSGGEEIGESVSMSAMVNRDEVIRFGDEDSEGEADEGVDAVIYF